MKITKEKFTEYLQIQNRGICNMLDYATIRKLSTLTKEEHRYIISNYSDLSTQHGISWHDIERDARR